MRSYSSAGLLACSRVALQLASNQKYYRVDKIAQLIDKYHPGGVIYVNWSTPSRNPHGS